MISRAEAERLKKCYLAQLRPTGVLEEVLGDLAEFSAQEIAEATVEMLDGQTRDNELRRRTDPDLSICREMLVEEVKRLRRKETPHAPTP